MLIANLIKNFIILITPVALFKSYTVIIITDVCHTFIGELHEKMQKNTMMWYLLYPPEPSGGYFGLAFALLPPFVERFSALSLSEENYTT